MFTVDQAANYRERVVKAILLFKFATGLVPEKGNLLKLMASNPWLNDPQNITDEDKKRMKVPGEKNLEGPLAMK